MPEPSDVGTLSPEEFQQVRRVFEAALERRADARAAFVARECAGDSRLVAEVGRMLAAENASHQLLDGGNGSRSPGRANRSRCASCRSPLGDGHRFCPACGTPVGADSIEGRFRAGALFANRFRIVAALGHGGMGEVYRAHDLELGQPVALKFLTALRSDERARARLRNEVRLARQLAHANVCRVYDIGEAHGELYLSMEYVDGEDLAALLKRIGRLPVDKGIEIARKLCAGLAAAHAKGVLHRDFKPANIMIDSAGEVRIMDFGLAAVASELDAKDIRSGTPAYMAPEQLAGREATVQSDLYALGLVLYELFTGKIAFTGKGIEELRRQRESHPSTSPATLVPELGPRVERAILRCLDPAPRQRPSSAIEVSASLPGGDPLAEALAAGETPSPEMVVQSGSRTGLRPTTAWAVAAFIGLTSFAAILLNQQLTPLATAASGKSPELLAERARTLVAKAGYGSPTDSTWAVAFDAGLLAYLREKDATGGRDRGLRTRDAVLFQSRESPVPLERETLTQAMSPLSDDIDPFLLDPPMRLDGDLRVVLNGDGQLRQFEAIPSNRQSVAETGTLDWSWILAEAGFSPSQLTESSPEALPAHYADDRRAWTAPHPDLPGITVRIEAAAYRGKLTDFAVVGPWDLATHGRQFALFSARPRLVLGVGQSGLVFLLVVPFSVAAIVLAYRNLRLGRGDVRGATRLAAFIVVVFVLHWLLTNHHVATLGLYFQLFVAVAVAVEMAGLLWVLYVALEPETRRRWPYLLVSSTRVLAGQWRDPLVGRDVLIGCALGAVGVLIAPYVLNLEPAWFGMADVSIPPVRLDTFVPVTHGMAFVLVNGIVVSLFFFFVWFVLRLALRSAFLAGAGWVLLVALQALGLPWLQSGLVCLAMALVVFVLTTFGWLPYVIGRVVYLMLQAPIVFDRSAWFAESGYTVLAVLGGLVLYGVWASTLDGRQPRLARGEA